MKRIRWATIVTATVAMSGCTMDAATAPAPAAAPSPEVLRDYSAFQLQVAQDIEAYLSNRRTRGARSETDAQRREQLTSLVALLEEQAGRAQVLAREGSRGWELSSPSLNMSGTEEVEAAGIIENTGTFTDIYLQNRDVAIFTKVSVPAVIDHNTSGTVTTNGWQFPINHTKSTSPFVTLAFTSNASLTEVDCIQAAASANAKTQHSVGWNVKGIGWVPASKDTWDTDECSPPSPPSGGGGGGGDGSGGGGWDLCRYRDNYNLITGDYEGSTLIGCVPIA